MRHATAPFVALRHQSVSVSLLLLSTLMLMLVTFVPALMPHFSTSPSKEYVARADRLVAR